MFFDLKNIKKRIDPKTGNRSKERTRGSKTKNIENSETFPRESNLEPIGHPDDQEWGPYTRVWSTPRPRVKVE